MRRWLVLAAFATVAAAWAPSVATAATVVVSGGTLQYVAAAGERNEVRVTVVGSDFRLGPAYDYSPPDPGIAGMEPQGPCHKSDALHVDCPSAGITKMSFTLGDGNDILIATGWAGSDAERVLVPIQANGGSGDDWLAGGFADDTLDGGPGDDRLTKGFLASNPLTIPVEGDVLRGGDGTDTVDYGTRITGTDSDAVTVTLDGVANDGRAGAHDQVAGDVEAVIGSGAADHITGGPAGDSLQGGGGPDVIAGGGGDDVIDGFLFNATGGGEGGDTLDGGPGKDRLSGGLNQSGGSGDDVLIQSGYETGDGALTGGPGDDLIEPAGYGTGRDVIGGDEGVDTVDYQQDWGGVAVSLDGQFNDGLGSDNVSAEILRGGTGADRLTGSGMGDTIDGGDGNDIVDGGGGTDVLDGGSGYDTLTYASHTTPVNVSLDGIANDGSSGENDDIDGGFEWFEGGQAADVMTGGPNADVLNGGPGADQIAGRAGADALSGGAGDDELSGDDGADQLIGGDGDDELHGGADVDSLIGEGGDDWLDGGNDAVADYLNGGAYFSLPDAPADGLDVADYSWASVPIVATLTSPSFPSAQVPGGDQWKSIDGIVGGSADDTLTGDGSANLLVGGSGADRLLGAAGDDELEGGPGDDQLTGGLGDDQLDGGAGKDTVSYAEHIRPVLVVLNGEADDGADDEYDAVGVDVEDVIGGFGNDLLIGDSGANALSGGFGDDLLVGEQGPDVLSGEAGADAAAYIERTAPVVASLDGRATSGNSDDGRADARDTILPDVEALYGGRGADLLTGDDASNLFNGGPGADVLHGGAGEDAADWSDRTDPVQASIDGAPTSGNAEDGPAGARDTVATDIEDLIGTPGADQLTGSPAANVLIGLAGDDTLASRDASADVDFCDTGEDRAVADASDTTEDCERVELPVATASPTPTAVVATPTATPALVARAPKLDAHQTLRTVLARGLHTSISCPAPCRATETLSTAPGTVVARLTKRRTSAGSLRLTLRIPARLSRRWRALHDLRLTLTTTVSVRSTTPQQFKQRLRLRRTSASLTTARQPAQPIATARAAVTHRAQLAQARPILTPRR